MRIVHILQGKANPETLNGVNKVVHWMATSQLQQGHDVEVWGLVASMTPPPHPREYKLRLFPVTKLRVTLGREIKAALGRLEAGTWVHFHSVFIPEYPAISQLLNKGGFAYGITPHGGYAPGVFKRNPWKKRLYVALREATYLRNAAWVHAIGESEIQDIARIDPGAHIVQIPNGQEFLSARSGAVPADAERPLIGFCGRLATQHKGLDYLIEGFASYKAKGGKGKLWLIGDGEDRAELERLATQSGAQPHVCFLGTKHGDEKLNLLASFDALIQSSRWEGLPMSCLEAASLGRPLLVSRETNLATYVEHSGAGLVLDETSSAGVCRVLERAAQCHANGELQTMGANARDLIQQEFGWEKNARRFVTAVSESVRIAASC